MNIVIVGQGAMGLLWYQHIQTLIKNDSNQGKNQLHLLASNKPLSSKKKHPFESYYFTDSNGLVHQENINYAHTENIQVADVVLFFLKSFQISTALSEISTLLKYDASIVLAHNGMGTLTELPQTVLEAHNVYALLTTHGCLRTAPLTIRHTGIGTTDIGLLSGVSDVAQQQAITLLLNSALPSVNYHKDIKQKQWLKLAINCVINPLTAINDIENGQIKEPEYKQVLTLLLEEVVAVAKAEGMILTLAELTPTVEKVARATAKNSSSMRCDVLAKRQTEIDYINGYINSLGTKHGIATPENTKMWQTVKNLESKK